MAGRKTESNGSDLSEQAAAAPAGEPTVGPGKPPIAHRFRKGQSGNPAGRPRRSGAPGDRLRGSDEPTRAMILEEAYRTVEVQDGDETITLPMNQAVFRAMGLAALKGGTIAQRRWAKMVQEAEHQQRRGQLAIYHAIERDERERASRRREYDFKEAKKYDPYAEDIIVDGRTGLSVIRGAEEE